MVDTAALPYHEPSIVSILILSSFLLCLNIINYILDRMVYCGLVGQIFIGIAWGVPGAGWLSSALQTSIVQLGYLGLILIVYEGGLSTNLKTLRANLALSATVALIGISSPIALSFVLQRMLPITALQAFAAGAALCSTSLGTTFTVLSTSGLADSRLGVVLASAAMMDDVVGLVMVQVISSLGGQNAEFDAVTVIRPVLVSIAFAVVVPLVCRSVVKPWTKSLYATASAKGKNLRTLESAGRLRRICFMMHTAALLGFVTAASYAGTSNLFTAYLAGAVVTWWSSSVEDIMQERSASEQTSDQSQTEIPETTSTRVGTAARDQGSPSSEQANDQPIERSTNSASRNPTTTEATSPSGSGLLIYDYYYKPAVETILKPFFFASIGFSIPISKMFTGQIVWRGFVYAALMTFGKLLCGLCLIRFAGPKFRLRGVWRRLPCGPLKSCWLFCTGRKRTRVETRTPTTTEQPAEPAITVTPDPSPAVSQQVQKKKTTLPKPLSLYPAAILGSAMVARGEIGFLISSVAQSQGIFKMQESAGSGGGGDELFLVVTWAILLCTVLGPVTVGVLVRRVKRLQQTERGRETGRQDPLGVWGVIGAPG